MKPPKTLQDIDQIPSYSWWYRIGSEPARGPFRDPGAATSALTKLPVWEQIYSLVGVFTGDRYCLEPEYDYTEPYAIHTAEENVRCLDKSGGVVVAQIFHKAEKKRR
jgi:hypothetical protein